MRSCPLCGRKYVRPEQVVRHTKEEALAQWRANRRATKAAAVAEAPVIPAARHEDEATLPVAPSVLPDLVEGSTTWTSTPIEVAPKLLTAGAAAMFCMAFVLGESVMLALQGSF